MTYVKCYMWSCVADIDPLLHRVLLQLLESRREIPLHLRMLEKSGAELQYLHVAKWVQEETTSLRLGLARLALALAWARLG